MRQQTLRATIDWSYDLMDDAERRTWRHLAVFAGGFTREAAERLGAGDWGLGIGERGGQNRVPSPRSLAGDTPSVLDLVSQLVDKSLVVLDEREGTARYRLLEPLRQYASERLTEAGEADTARERLVDWCLERDASRGLRLAGNLGQFWMAWRLDPEGQRWRDALLDRASEDTKERAHALFVAGVVARDFGDYPTAISRLREAHVTATKIGDQSMLSWTLLCLGLIDAEQGNYAGAKTRLDDSLRLAREVGNDAARADTIRGQVQLALGLGDYDGAQAMLDEYLADRWVEKQRAFYGLGLAQSGALAHAAGDLPRAKALLEESVALLRSVVDRPSLGLAVAQLGYVVGSMGDFKEGDALHREALTLFQKMGHRPRAARTLFFMGLVAIRERMSERGVTLVAAAEAVPFFFLTGLDPAQRADRDGRLADSRLALGDAAFNDAWARGSAMTFDRAVAFALASQAEPGPG